MPPEPPLQPPSTVEWRPSATLEILQTRARILAAVRHFFAERGVMEVETPLLSAAAASAPHLDSLMTCYSGPGAPHGLPLYLQTSPEFAMKRLLAAGSGSIYQITKAFRNGESGRRHNPEFTLLEWYRPGLDHHALMDEVEMLVSQLLAGVIEHRPSERMSYQQALQRYAQVDVYHATCQELRARAREAGINGVNGLAADDREAWLDLLLTHLVEPHLGRGGEAGQGHLCFISDYPAAQAALARLRNTPAGHQVAERFELYVQGVELASGYHELADSREQRARFEQDLARRQALHKASVTLDEGLLAALDHLPDCAGVALGLDRLVMLAVRASSLAEVLAFPLGRA